ncbi:hypothetical protein HNP99_000765 [Flavobacterium sp. 28A]|uniref:hypothetical protein n=1 Tax=Flavobacterium sp. 28A TaxID=2735895 RepID=UPI00156D6393|nr:hypothetical protein [Flavobacterium sp. 28A]NRT14425.1 hypothetical protein [Flavobacterium sp. 28A]
MKLTNQQIDTINETLVLNGLVYDDIKLELVDHIASEIELAMDHKEVLFEDALKTAFSNWQGQLHGSRSYWIRGYAFIPKIIIKKALKMVKHIFLMSLAMGIITAVAVTFIFKFNPQQEVLFVLNSMLQGVSVIGILLIIYLKFKLRQSKHKSTYSFLFNQNGFIQVITLIMLATGIFNLKGYSNFSDFHFMSALLPITWLFISGFYLNVGFQHLRFEKKVSKV